MGMNLMCQTKGIAAIRGHAQLKTVSRKYPSMQCDQIDIVVNN